MVLHGSYYEMFLFYLPLNGLVWEWSSVNHYQASYGRPWTVTTHTHTHTHPTVHNEALALANSNSSYSLNFYSLCLQIIIVSVRLFCHV